MRTLLIVITMLLLPQAGLAKDYKPGTVFNDIVEFSFPAGRWQVPLPPGNWKLLYKTVYRTSTSNIPIISFYFARHSKKKLTGAMRVVVPKGVVDFYWLPSKTCSRRNYRKSWYFKEDVYDGYENCNVVYPIRGFNRNNENLKKFFKYVDDHSLTTPNAWLRARFARVNGADMLRVNYALPQENYGFPRERKYSNAENPWSINNIAAFPKKKAFMEKAKKWADSWSKLIDKGFQNELRKAEVTAHPMIDGTIERPGTKSSAAPKTADPN